ncbi:MAG: hypothetical protein Kow00114_00980 [Kiloniellaceae bacterium]
MQDKLIGIAAIAILAAFMVIHLVFVPDVDLILILAGVTLMAAYDFYLTLFKRKNGG